MFEMVSDIWFVWNDDNALYIHSPQNKEELFNLQHSFAWNVVKRIFRVLKHCFHILLIPYKFSIELQAQIPTALSAVHNFIQNHNSSEDNLNSDKMDDNQKHTANVDDLDTDGAVEVDLNLGDGVQAMCNQIADAM